jgi:AsmA-like C-terminal region/AsmA family
MSMPRWLRLVVSGAALLFVLSFAFSRALRLSSARRYLIAHLAASFGRPVEVAWFDFSLLDGARVEAHQVTVSEDPRFGNEYFLRADTVAAGLRWSSLLAGRFEFGSVLLSRPSLNLVRDAEGQWNIERWLPPAPRPAARPGFVGPLAPSPDVRATRAARIEIEQGRVNFKRGDNKLPFALVDVAGGVAEDGSGHWQLDLEARPMRAGVQLQDIGTVRLRGSIAGTTARLQPAELTLAWRSASLADTLRLISQNDYGIRGQLDVDLAAHIEPSWANSALPASSGAHVADTGRGGAEWSISGVARVTGFHGWRLAERATDPAANLSVDLDWRLGEPQVQIHKLRVDMPASHLEAAGEVGWSRGIHPELRIANSSVAFADALAWYRALQPGVAEDLQPAGILGLDLKLSGWPLQLQEGAVTSSGGALTAKALPARLQLGALRATVSHGKVDLSPAEISFAPPVGAGSDAVQAASTPRNRFLVRGSIGVPSDSATRWPANWSLSIDGTTSRVQDWLALSAALAQPVNSGWSASGGLAVKIQRERRAGEAAPSPWTGTMDFVALTLSPSYVNQPVSLPKAHIEFTPTQRTITLSAAAAFGATWRGSIARKFTDEQWSFDLTADRLDALELDRWLGPRARPGFLARIIGSDSSVANGPLADALVTRLAAHGRLRAGSISVPPLHIEKFDGQAELTGRTIRIRAAQGDFFGGKVFGALDADLLRDPSYEFHGRFDRIDLGELARAVPSLDGRIAGAASATLNLSAHGVGREELTGSLDGEGTLSGHNVSLRGIDFSTAAISGSELDAAPELFAALQGSFRIRNRSVDLADFVMSRAGGELVADGRVEFSHALNVRIRSSVAPPAPASASDPPQNFLLGGTLESPNLTLASAVLKPPARASAR